MIEQLKIAPGKPGFFIFEGDVYDLRVLQQRVKCYKWKEFRFLSQFPTSSPSSPSPTLPFPPIEYLHQKWKEQEAKNDGLVQSVIDKAHFVDMLLSLQVPKHEVDLLLKYLPQ